MGTIKGKEFGSKFRGMVPQRSTTLPPIVEFSQAFQSSGPLRRREPSWLRELMAQPFLLMILLCMSLLLFQVIRLYQRRRWTIRAMHLFPAPPVHWFYGHKEFYPVKEFEVYPELMEKYPCAVPLWVGPFTMFFNIHDPDYVKILLKRQDPKSAVSHKILESWVGRGLVTLDGSKWKKHRQIVKPGFNISILKIFITMMSESVRMMLNKWEEHIAQNSRLELFQHVSLMTLDSIMKCAFSHQGSIQLDSTLDSYLKAVFNLSKISNQRMNNFLHHNDLVFKFSSQGQIFSKFNQELHQFTEKVIQDRKESLKDKLKQDTTQKRRWDFLDILLSAESENTKDFSEADLQAEVKTFMFAGHDTTSSAIFWIFYCLAKYPEHQQRRRDEIRELLGDGSSITWEHLSQMPYTTMCIKECLRLYAPVVNISGYSTNPLPFQMDAPYLQTLWNLGPFLFPRVGERGESSQDYLNRHRIIQVQRSFLFHVPFTFLIFWLLRLLRVTFWASDNSVEIRMDVGGRAGSTRLTQF
nr:putative inactive cytochrome P450 family member 4Z2 [Pan troglodytes]